MAQLSGRPLLESNAMYITCQIGDLFLIYDRKVTDPKILKASLIGVQQVQLFADNYVYAYFSSYVQVFTAQ